MGLDKDDEIVKRRMAQKMQFLAEDVAAAHEPTTAELSSWYEKNRDKFQQPPRVSFRHLYFSLDRRGPAPARMPKARSRSSPGSPRTRSLRRRSPIRSCSRSITATAPRNFSARSSGRAFALAIPKLPPGSWQGPVESGFGWHLVFVDTLVPGRVPPFEEIEGDVKTAWLAEQKAAAWEKAYKDMRAKYTVLVPAPPDAQIGRARRRNAAQEGNPDVVGRRHAMTRPARAASSPRFVACARAARFLRP